MQFDGDKTQNWGMNCAVPGPEEALYEEANTPFEMKRLYNNTTGADDDDDAADDGGDDDDVADNHNMMPIALLHISIINVIPLMHSNTEKHTQVKTGLLKRCLINCVIV